MQKWKIIHIHIVPGRTREEAIDKFLQAIHDRKTDDYYEVEIIKKHDEPQGWFGNLKKQITGK